MEKSVLFVIAPKDFRDEELFEPKQIFEEAGYDCVVASLTLDVCTGMMGAEVTPDLTLRDVQLDDYCAVIMVGGSGVLAIYENKDLLELFDDSYRKGLVIGAICLGPMVLARAGLLKGKRSTVFKIDESISLFRECGCAYVTDDVVCDGRVVTANGPAVAKQFGQACLRLLSHEA